MKIDDNILELAVTQAHKSPMHYRHGGLVSGEVPPGVIAIQAS